MTTASVTDQLAARDIPFTVYLHHRAFTGSDEARALGADPNEVAKTIVLDTEAGHVLAVIPASKRLEMGRVREILGAHTHLADEREIEHDIPQYELGAIPPLAWLLLMPTYVDESLAQRDSIVFAAGHQTESVRIKTSDLLADPGTTVAALTRPPYEER